MRNRDSLLAVAAVLASPAWLGAATVMLSGPTLCEDTTLYSNAVQDNAGATTSIRSGPTNTAGLRRALIRFNLSSIPAGSTITGVSLRLTVTNISGGASSTAASTLHRVTASWVEGNGFGSGVGGQVVAGAASWSFRETATLAWTTPGGDFAATESASLELDDNTGNKTWASAGMIADVQAWLDGAQPNHGWILIVDETLIADARGFNSAEAPTSQPLLTVDYTPGALSTANGWLLYQ